MQCKECCAELGGCPADYVAVGITAVSLIILACSMYLFIRIREVPEIRLKQIKLLLLQSVASMTFLLSLLMSRNIFRLGYRKSWKSCYIWQVWLEGPLGFGLLMSCHVVRVYRLYHLFVKRHLPPLKSYQLLLLLLLPWCAASTVMQMKGEITTSKCKFNHRHFPLIAILHGSYVLLLVGGACTIRKIEFQFQEFHELIKGVIVSLFFLAMWTALFMANELLKKRRLWLEVLSRFMLILMANVFVLSFIWIPVWRPLLAQFSKRKENISFCETMGQALRVPHSECLAPPKSNIDMNEPLEALLKQRRFRQSFLAFSESRMAGEFMHFYEEVHELNKIPVTDTARRVYMTGHIIENYIQVGSSMEINISHQMRQEILGTDDLANPNLFKQATREAVQVMHMNLLKDYLQSAFFRQFKDIQAEPHFSQPLSEPESWEYALETKCHHSIAHESSDPFDEALQNCYPKEDDNLELVTNAQYSHMIDTHLEGRIEDD